MSFISGANMRLFERSALSLVVFAVALVALLAGTPRAQAQLCDCEPSDLACNKVRSQTILPPDRIATVYVTLNSTCAEAGICIKGCAFEFDIPSFLSTTEKCHELAAGIEATPACQDAGYVIESNDCEFGQTFTVTDVDDPDSVLSLGISNDPSIFSQTGAGEILPDYEAEIITPACSDPDGEPGTGDEMMHQMTFKGEATGVPITGSSSNVMAIADLRPLGGSIVLAELPTDQGMPAEEIAERLAGILRQNELPCEVVGGRGVRCRQPSSQVPVGFAINTNDIGIAIGNHQGPDSVIPIPDADECTVSGSTMNNQCAPVINHSDCFPAAGGVYCPVSSLDTLALLYGGLHQDGTLDCNSQVREALIRVWANVHEGSCGGGACNELSHAWRGDDTDAAVIEWLAKMGLKEFCNGTVLEDDDPMRRRCLPDDDVCQADGTAGIVLPINVPENLSTAMAYPRAPCQVGNFGLADAQRIDLGGGGVLFNCPERDNFSIAGFCLAPRTLGGRYDCLSPRNNPNVFFPSLVDDARLFNRWLRARDGSLIVDDEGRDVTNAWYRIRTNTCTEPNSDNQICCLSEDYDTCSIGEHGLLSPPEPVCKPLSVVN